MVAEDSIRLRILKVQVTALCHQQRLAVFPTRGGEPAGTTRSTSTTAFSPHAWGVNDPFQFSPPALGRFPHTRGG